MGDVHDITAKIAEARNIDGRSPPVASTLQHGGGGGTYGGMSDALIDAKVAAAEARTDTKFSELRGSLSSFATRGTVWGAVASIIGALAVAITIVLAVLAYASNRFDAGMTVRSAVDAATSDIKKRDDAQDRKLDEILRRLPK